MTTITLTVETARTLLMLGTIHGTSRNERVAVNELTRALRGAAAGAKAEPVRRQKKAEPMSAAPRDMEQARGQHD